MIAVLACGGKVIRVDIRLRPPDSGGRTEFSLSSDNPVSSAWHSLVVSVAGAAVDLADGCRDAGCVSDLRAAGPTPPPCLQCGDFGHPRASPPPTPGN